MDSRKHEMNFLLRNARLLKGYSQQQVAAFAGIHVRQYQRLEYGERSFSKINMRLGLLLCAILEINPYRLVFTPEQIRNLTEQLRK